MQHCTSSGSSVLVSDGSYLIGFFGVGFFSLPSFQNKETETFHAIECKLHAALKQTEHFNIYLFTPALPPSSSWTVLFLLLGSCGQAAIKGTSDSPYKYRWGCSCWRSWAIRPRRLYKYSSWILCDSSGVCFSHPWARDSSTVLCSHPGRLPVHPWGWWRRRGGGTNIPDISKCWGRLVWDGSLQLAHQQVGLCGFPAPAPLRLFAAPVTVPHARQTRVRDDCEAGRGLNAQGLSHQQMIRTLRKPILFTVSAC